MAVPAALDNLNYTNCDAGISLSLHNCKRFRLLTVRFSKGEIAFGQNTAAFQRQNIRSHWLCEHLCCTNSLTLHIASF